MLQKTNLFLVSSVVLSLVLFAAADRPVKRESCAEITEALTKVGELKPGDSRALVERNFELDGGMHFFPVSRYSFKKCPFIKVDVEFSPADRVVKISRPYLEYPYRD